MRPIDADALEDYIDSDRSGLMSAKEYKSDYIECIDEMPTIDEDSFLKGLFSSCETEQQCYDLWVKLSTSVHMAKSDREREIRSQAKDESYEGIEEESGREI